MAGCSLEIVSCAPAVSSIEGCSCMVLGPSLSAPSVSAETSSVAASFSELDSSCVMIPVSLSVACSFVWLDASSEDDLSSVSSSAVSNAISSAASYRSPSGSAALTGSSMPDNNVVTARNIHHVLLIPLPIFFFPFFANTNAKHKLLNELTNQHIPISIKKLHKLRTVLHHLTAENQHP